MRRIVAFGPAFVVLVCSAVVLFAVPGAIRAIGAAQTRARVTLAQQRLDQDEVLVRLNAAVREVSASVEPSVVHIEVGSGRGELRSSSGSGWVWDEAGFIVTNAHVVAGASRIEVQFHDGQTARATLVGTDPASDIALIKVEAGPQLVAMRRATGERVFKGDRVFAFGSPFGFKFSMSEGIVSGLGRSARTAMGFAGFSNFIQTDAAVNPGNSGGPLVDVRGRLVGMNVAIATAQETQGSTEGQSAGISFAIPLAMIESRVPRLMSGGPVPSGFLGIRFGIGDSRSGAPLGGVVVTEVEPDGPSAKAGLFAGDIILAIDEQELAGSESLRGMISSTSPGQVVQLKVRRGEDVIQMSVTLGEFPSQSRAREYQQALMGEFGLTLRDTPEGPAVGMVFDELPAAKCGFVSGMRIKSIGGKAVKDANEAVGALLSLGLLAGRTVEVVVIEGEAERELALRMVRE
ncbi:putative serine protease PepD [Phycisphaerales bacterium]|nr:putative serine protease PepD [Phycisphaerales bacterium]